MTDTELSILESLAKAATPGPWEVDSLYNIRSEDKVIVLVSKTYMSREPTNENAAYIAAANPAVILKLIAELRQARKERDWLAENMPNSYSECHCPEGHYKPDCEPEPTAGGKICYECLLCWLEAAKEATCQK